MQTTQGEAHATADARDSEAHTASGNVDAAEIAKFTGNADQWWDRHGPYRTLHDINPLRLNWIDARAPLTGQRVLDVGCGAGILSEALAVRGGQVTGIDAGAEHLAVAREHARDGGLDIDYRHTTAEELAARVDAGTLDAFPIVVCMEMLEHVPDPESVLAALATLTAPGGQLFVSTLSRTPKAFLHAIVGAEYILGMLPRGTHEYQRFIRPSEIARVARHHDLHVRELAGLGYSPLTKRYQITRNVEVNYLMQMERPGDCVPSQTPDHT